MLEMAPGKQEETWGSTPAGSCLFSRPILAGPLEVVISPYQLCLVCPQAITAAVMLWLWKAALKGKSEVL